MQAWFATFITHFIYFRTLTNCIYKVCTSWSDVKTSHYVTVFSTALVDSYSQKLFERTAATPVHANWRKTSEDSDDNADQRLYNCFVSGLWQMVIFYYLSADIFWTAAVTAATESFFFVTVPMPDRFAYTNLTDRKCSRQKKRIIIWLLSEIC